MTDVDFGEMRRAPRLWEQQLADSLGFVAPGDAMAAASGPVQDDVLDDDASQPTPDPTVPTDLPTPSAPTWRSGIAMIVVTWNGLDQMGEPWPTDTSSWVEAHVSPTPNFTPSKATKQGIFLQGAGDVPSTALKADTDYWIALVGRDDLGGMTKSVEVKGHTGLIMDTDIGKGAITADKVSFDAREIGGVTTGIGSSLPTDAKQGDIFLLKVTNPEGGVTALKQYQFDGSKWNPVEWGADALSAKCITAQQMTAGSIVAGAIAADAVLARNIKAGEITADKIATGTITANSACIQSLDADKITAGFLAVDRIKAGTFTGQNMKTPKGADDTSIWIGDPDGSGSDYIRFYKGNNIKGLIKFRDGGGIQIGGFPGDGGNDPLTITGSDGMVFDTNVIPDATYNANHRVLGVNASGRLVGYKTPPKDANDTPAAAGESVDDLRELVRDLQEQVAQLTGRIEALEAR